MERYQSEFDKWKGEVSLDKASKIELLKLTEVEKEKRFKEYMDFGTAGLRAKMGVGTAFMNLYTVAHATAGLAKLICSEGEEAKERGVAIAYDSRNNSPEFARRAAEVLSANDIKVYLFDKLR
ncbi:MAG: phospho-sugar mutase, partial [Clostridia bacterium]|nr:phospho-sugar mutase [Clostridia bacterium]